MLELILLSLGGFLWRLSDMVLKPRRLSYDSICKAEEKRGRFNRSRYDALRKYEFILASDFGYPLSCVMLTPDSCNLRSDSTLPDGKADICRRIAVLCHGFNSSKCASFIYAEMFLKMGFTVIIYDHRNHGLSGKSFTSMGYYERYDLRKVIDWCYDKFGDNIKIVTHGESMGGATVLLHLEIDDRVKCVIADCAYSDLTLLLRHQLKIFYHFPMFLIPVESMLTFLRAGFKYKQVSPIRVVRAANTPILFIHGKRDNYVPTWMSRQMYDAKKDRKAIYLVSGARHAQSFFVNRAGYRRVVEGFLSSYLEKQ
jgi:fermentation-respiration switch protein FrsA (DUF1100 family)